MCVWEVLVIRYFCVSKGDYTAVRYTKHSLTLQFSEVVTWHRLLLTMRLKPVKSLTLLSLRLCSRPTRRMTTTTLRSKLTSFRLSSSSATFRRFLRRRFPTTPPSRCSSIPRPLVTFCCSTLKVSSVY